MKLFGIVEDRSDFFDIISLKYKFAVINNKHNLSGKLKNLEKAFPKIFWICISRCMLPPSANK
jgi:hypothetical protein